MPIRRVLNAGLGPVAKVWTEEIEPEAEEQLLNLLTLPFIFKHLAVMPDVHWGIGSTVGTVLVTKRAVIPAAVGVDIGCGMMAYRLDMYSRDLPDNLERVRAAIEKAVPHGRTNDGGINDRGAWGEAPEDVQRAALLLSLDPRFAQLAEGHPHIVKRFSRSTAQLGTLGTGNHFVELCEDEGGQLWVMLHSGSRGIGNLIGTSFIEAAREQMELYHIELADPNLAYFPEGTKLFDDYWNALSWAQDYAQTNRKLMMHHTLIALSNLFGRQLKVDNHAINCHHNYATRENHFGQNVIVTRKGAVRARAGDLGIIPGSMGARSYIVSGKGCDDAFHSCSHGAGRRMSRKEATRRFSVEDLRQQTSGVECRKDAGVLDEIPGAYKDISEVMRNQEDLVEVLCTLKQLVCVKG